MPDNFQPLFQESFLLSAWDAEYREYLAKEDAAFLARLRNWTEKHGQKETQAEAAFIQVFFRETWAYALSGDGDPADGFTAIPQFSIPKAGQSGGAGRADLVLGLFGRSGGGPDIPQVACEFKDIRSGLDTPQKRKGNDRSPVRQCADYLRCANDEFAPYGHEPIRAAWAVVTDMNEFRLYHQRTIPHQYQRFILRPSLGMETPLTGDGEAAALQRFLFRKLFHADMLLTPGGPGPLEQLLKGQLVREKELERDFYAEYHAFRETAFQAITQANPDLRVPVAGWCA